MNYIIFSDGTKLPCKRVEEGPLFFDGQQRRALTIHISPAEVGFDALDALLRDEDKTMHLMHLNDAVPTTRAVQSKGEEAIGMVEEALGEAKDLFDDYTLRVELAKRGVPNGTDVFGEEMKEDTLVAVLARKTALERKVDTMMAAMKKANILLDAAEDETC